MLALSVAGFSAQCWLVGQRPVTWLWLCYLHNEHCHGSGSASGGSMEKHGETGRGKMQAMKTGDFLGQIGFMMLNQSSGFESCVRLEPWNPGILGVAVGDAPRCFPWNWWSNCELQKGQGLGAALLSLAPEFEHWTISSDTSNEGFLTAISSRS